MTLKMMMSMSLVVLLNLQKVATMMNHLTGKFNNGRVSVANVDNLFYFPCRMTRNRSKDQPGSDTSPDRKMFMIARHGAYSGQMAMKRRQDAKSPDLKRSPTRLMFGSPRRDVASPPGSPRQVRLCLILMFVLRK